MKRDDYRWYGEKPFPWTLLAWPFLWLYGTVRGWRKPKAAQITQPTIRPREPADTCKSFAAVDEEKLNLLKTDPDEFFRRYPRREINWSLKIGDTDYE